LVLCNIAHLSRESGAALDAVSGGYELGGGGATLSKDEILEIYLNSVYLGRSSWGVEMAARP
jgi:hypothetical protein